MARKKAPTIGLADIEAFLREESDFAFEMRVLHKLREIDFECEHGGTYEDPVTQKRRQFDIRARLVRSPFDLRLAVECKNLRESSPLLIHAVKRRVEEAFHHLIVRRAREEWSLVSVERYESTYEPEQLVGKSLDQVARGGDGEFKRSDADVFEKVMQAVNSARDQIDSAARIVSPTDTIISVIPMLVVPDGMLWQVDYEDNGTQVGPPRQVNYCTYYLNHPWHIVLVSSLPFPFPPYRLSHLELVTFSGLLTRAATHLFGEPPGFPRGVFALRDAVFNRPRIPRR